MQIWYANYSSEQDPGNAGKEQPNKQQEQFKPDSVQIPEIYPVKVINVLTIANPRIIASRIERRKQA